MIVDWLVWGVVKFVLGETFLVALTAGLALGLAVLCIIRGYKGLAYLSAFLGCVLVAFMVGYFIKDDKAAREIAALKSDHQAELQQIKDDLQAAETIERERQATARQTIRDLDEANRKLRVAAIGTREKAVENVRIKYKVVAGKCDGWNDAEFGRLRQIIGTTPDTNSGD